MVLWNPKAYLPNPPAVPLPVTAAVFMLQGPSPNSAHVGATPLLRIALYEDAPSINLGTFRWYLDEQLIYEAGSTGFLPLVRGTVVYVAGGFASARSVYSCVPRTPFEPGSLHTLRATITVSGTPQSTIWSFRVQEPQDVFLGADLSPIEQYLLTPMSRFLDTEPLRRAFLNLALREPPPPGVDADALAARVMYQLAFGTEVSVILNPFLRPKQRILDAKIPQRRRAHDLDRRLAPLRTLFEVATEDLISQGALPREYRTNLVDYSQSMLYPYRVSAIAALILYAKAVENLSASAAAQIFEHGLGADLPFDLGG